MTNAERCAFVLLIASFRSFANLGTSLALALFPTSSVSSRGAFVLLDVHISCDALLL